MKILFLLLIFLLLLFPETAAEGSKNGLILWATALVPSLLPFSILSSLLRNSMQRSPLKHLLLGVGILSGYPIGAKMAADLYREGALTPKQALFFIGFTNNPSPMFVIFYVAENMLHLGASRYLFYLLVLLSSFLGSLLFLLLSNNFIVHSANTASPCPSSTSTIPLSKVIDNEIAASTLLLLKIGGYIMMFSLFAAMIRELSIFPLFSKIFFCGLLEVTTGNAFLCQCPLTHSTKIILSLAITTFGGLSAVAQTNSVLQNTGLSIIHYVIIKFISSGFAVLFATLLLI